MAAGETRDPSPPTYRPMSGPASGAVVSSTCSPATVRRMPRSRSVDLQVTQQGIDRLRVDAAQLPDLPAGQRSLGHEQERLQLAHADGQLPCLDRRAIEGHRVIGRLAASAVVIGVLRPGAWPRPAPPGPSRRRIEMGPHGSACSTSSSRPLTSSSIARKVMATTTRSVMPAQQVLEHQRGRLPQRLPDDPRAVAEGDRPGHDTRWLIERQGHLDRPLEGSRTSDAGSMRSGGRRDRSRARRGRRDRRLAMEHPSARRQERRPAARPRRGSGGTR